MNGQNLPPADIPADDLFRALMARPCPSEVADYPGHDRFGKPLGRVRVMVLSDEQRHEARFMALEKLRKRMTEQQIATPVGAEILGDLIARECIVMAFHGVNPMPGFEDGADIRYPLLFPNTDTLKKLPADEIMILFGLYELVQKRLGPSAKELDDDEVNAWVRRLEEGASEIPLARLASHQLAELCLRLSVRAAALSRCLNSQRQNLPINWESIPASWVMDTFSSGEPAAASTPSSDDSLITPEQAMAAARKLQKG